MIYDHKKQYIDEIVKVPPKKIILDIEKYAELVIIPKAPRTKGINKKTIKEIISPKYDDVSKLTKWFDNIKKSTNYTITGESGQLPVFSKKPSHGGSTTRTAKKISPPTAGDISRMSSDDELPSKITINFNKTITPSPQKPSPIGASMRISPNIRYRSRKKMYKINTFNTPTMNKSPLIEVLIDKTQIDLSSKSITLFMASDIKMADCVCAYKQCMDLAKFSEYKLMTSDTKGVRINGVELIKTNTIKSRSDYSKLILTQLNDIIKTDYVLIVQYDGFIVNPGAWDDIFLEYDYWGAPVCWAPNSPLVGNGGFSLRSKKLLELISANISMFAKIGYDPEDQVICCNCLQWFKQQGIKYPTVDVASKKFAWQPYRNTFKYSGQFGVHVGSNRNDIRKYIHA